MPISFAMTENTLAAQRHFRRIADEQMRPLSRKYDDEEHTLPKEWVDYWWNVGRKDSPETDLSKPTDGFIQVCVQAEELCFGDAGLYLRMPTPALGGSAVSAAGTKEQREKFMAGFRAEGGHPIWGAMAITEASAGSDSAAIQTTADFDESTNEWVLNGTKIFCTAGEGASTGRRRLRRRVGDRRQGSAGRGGIKSFVVPANTPGMKLVGTPKTSSASAPRTPRR